MRKYFELQCIKVNSDFVAGAHYTKKQADLIQNN